MSWQKHPKPYATQKFILACLQILSDQLNQWKYSKKGEKTLIFEKLITLNTLVFNISKWARETPSTVWQQTRDRFAIRMLCKTYSMNKKKGFHYIDLKNFTKNIISKPGRSKLFGNLAHLWNAANLSLLEPVRCKHAIKVLRTQHTQCSNFSAYWCPAFPLKLKQKFLMQ